MDIRYHVDADSGLPHIYGHGVIEREVEELMRRSGEDLPGTGSSRIRLGQTADGRYLQVIYVPDDDPRSIFVVTAYDLQGKAKQAYRRRRRRRGR